MKQRILLLDNFDSFTYNLKHYIDEVSGTSCTVKRNDEISVKEAREYDAFVLSPGPGLPQVSGILVNLISELQHEKKMLGVCLGHQAMAVATGGELKQLQTVMHGLKRKCILSNEPGDFYKGIAGSFDAGRYHSWVVEEASLPFFWKVTSYDESGEIMSIEHKDYPLYGVQYHPESIMTKVGKQLLKNWLAL